MQNNENIIPVFGDINDKLSLFILKRLRYFSKIGENVTLYINSDGGYIEAAISIIDTINYFKKFIGINTIVCGRACSAAVNILIMGNNRSITKNSFLMLHPASYDLSQDYTHVHKSTVEFWNDKSSKFIDMVINEIKPSYRKKIKANITNGIWLDSKEALNLGLVNNIC